MTIRIKRIYQRHIERLFVLMDMKIGDREAAQRYYDEEKQLKCLPLI